MWQALSPVRQKVLPINNTPKALLAGMLWGLLPCGLVYGALGVAVSLSATSHISGMGVLFMLVFGLGTVPMLVVSGVALSWIQSKIKAFNLRRFSGVVMLVSGLFVMLSPVVMHHLHGHDHGGHGHHHHTSPTHHHHHH